MNNSLIQFSHVSKYYGEINAVDNLNFSIRQGEIFGLLGPNGAGKTTAILMLLGLIPPTSGQIFLFGEAQNTVYPSFRQKVGVVQERHTVYPDLTAMEYLTFFGNLYNVRNLDHRASDVLDLVGLSGRMHTIVGGFSRGMQLKLGLARALLPDPEILILDEPVEGLDPSSILEVRNILLHYHELGKTILLSSHVLSEVERLTDRVGILNQGRLLAVGDLGSLRDHIRKERKLLIEIDNYKPEIRNSLKTLPFVSNVTLEDEYISVMVPKGDDYRACLARTVAEAGGIAVNIKNEEISLEQVFIKITSDNVDLLAADAARITEEEAKTTKSIVTKSDSINGWKKGNWFIPVKTLITTNLNTLLFTPAHYILLAVILTLEAVVCNSHLSYVANNNLLVLSKPWSLPFSVGVFLIAIYLSVSASVTLTQERESGTLQVLFFGPIDESSYILGLFFSRVLLYIFWILLLLSGIYGYMFWSGIVFAWEPLVVASAFAIFPLCIMVALGLFISSIIKSLRGALIGYLGVIVFLESIQWGRSSLVQVSEGSRSYVLNYAEDIISVLATVAGWLSPFQYFTRGLEAAFPSDMITISSVGLFYFIVLLVSTIIMLKRRTVLP